MKNTNFYTRMLLIFFASFLVGCSSNPGTSFIPGFNATWPVQGDADRQIDLQPDEANKNVPHGVFNGKEIINDTIENQLSGSFNGLDIEFTIQRSDHESVQYTGRMIPISEIDHFIIRIELSSSEAPMILAR